jgi:hypothetical protein
MKAYLFISGIIFAAFSLLHVARFFEKWQDPKPDVVFLSSVVAIAVGAAALSVWAFRLTRLEPPKA